MGNESAAFDREKFESWRAAHPGNALAFDQAARSWGLPLPVEATRYAHSKDGDTREDLHKYPPQTGHRRVGLMACAAVIVLGVAGIGLEKAGLFGSRSQITGTPIAGTVITSQEHVRAIRLSDGSIAALGVNSELAVSFTHDVRSLTLLRGNARFDVAHDSNRLFEVQAGQSVITAHGTLFDVRLGPQGTQVTLLRGAIDVARIEGVRRTGDVRKLTPGQTITIPNAGPMGAVKPTTTSEAFSGDMLTFDRTTLPAAIDALNKRNDVKIVTESLPENETITGGFDPSDPRAFAHILASMFDLALTQQANGDLILSGKR